MEDLIQSCTEEGIPIYSGQNKDSVKPIDVLFEEYTVIQLSPAFMSHVGEHRTMYSACRRQRTPSGGFFFDSIIGHDISFRMQTNSLGNIKIPRSGLI